MKRWLTWSHAWCHRDVLKRRKKIAPMLLDFGKAGHLTIIESALEDIASIVEIIGMVKDRGLLSSVAVDPAGLGEFVDALAAPEVDITQDNGLLVGVPQGYALMNAIKTAERRLSNGMLQHAGGTMMAWCVANLKIEPTATAIRATKQTAGDAKIDPAMALFDAVTMMVKNPEAFVASSSPWDDPNFSLVVA
jgi:phage terminase large subunit-like protein